MNFVLFEGLTVAFKPEPLGSLVKVWIALVATKQQVWSFKLSVKLRNLEINQC